MLRALPFIIGIVLIVYCLVELVQSPRDQVRALPRGAWAAVICLLPFVGPILWLIGGRPVPPDFPAPTARPGAGQPRSTGSTGGQRGAGTGRSPTASGQAGTGHRGGPGSGHPGRSRSGARAPLAPDDDPEFLAELGRKHRREEEERLRRWQAELEEREREQRGPEDSPGDDGDDR